MICGQSSSQGVVLYEASKDGINGIICRFENGDPKYKLGKHKELMKEMDETDDIKTSTFLLHLLFSAAVYAGVLYLLFRTLIDRGCGFFPLLGAGFWTLTSFIPVTIMGSFPFTRWTYRSKEAFHSFRRMHGAEHAVLNHYKKGKTVLELDKIRKRSRIHRRCGSAHLGLCLLFFLCVSIAIGAFPILRTLEFQQILRLAAIAVLVLIINPFLILQQFITEKPSDPELQMVMEGLQLLESAVEVL